MAANAAITIILRMLLVNGTLPKSEIDKQFAQVIGAFQRPQSRSAQVIAGEVMRDILRDASKPPPGI
jgi:hypothetical protein